MSRIKEIYDTKVIPELMKELGLKNKMQVPSLNKIVINMGVGAAVQDPKHLEAAMAELALIAGQQPVVRLAKRAEAGFKIVKARYVDLLGILPWLVFNKWLKKTEFNPAMVLLYDRFGIPTTKMVERLSGAPIGKNILLVAKK